jgi:hypothetical protein
MVTHNWQRLVDVDRVLVLQEGKPAFDGSPEELLLKIPTRDFADLDLSRLGGRQESATGDCFPVSSGPKRQRAGFQAVRRRTREMALQFWSLLRREGAILASPIGNTQAWRNPLFGLLRAAFALVRDRPARRGKTGFFELGSASIPAANGLSTRSKGGLRHWLRSNRALGPPAPRTARSALTGGFRILRRVALPLFWAPLFFASALALSVKSTEVEQLGFFAVLATIWMGASLSLMSIVDEREVFDHERLLFLHVVPYVAAKMIPLWILSLLQTCVFAALLAMFRGQTGWLYGGIWPVAYLVPVGLAATGMGLVISAIANRSAPTANLILPLAMIAQIVFNVHVAGDGKAELDEAYGGFHARHCQATGCNSFANVWLPHDGWRCREHGLAPDDSEVCNRWAARASYGTIARYGDIALRSFAYKKPDAEAYLGRDPQPSSVQRRRKLHEDFGYSVWRKDAVRSLAAMIVCFPALAIIVLWRQSSHPFKASGSVKPLLAQSHRSDFAKSAATPDCAADQLPG